MSNNQQKTGNRKLKNKKYQQPIGVLKMPGGRDGEGR